MSAFIVSYNHINTLINYAAAKQMRFNWRIGEQVAIYDPRDPNDAQTLGAILINENVRSILARYQSDKAEDYIDWKCNYRYELRRDYANISPIQIIKACDCYDYQACETEDYDSTFAALISKWIKSEAVHSLPGYDSAQWEIQ